MTKTILILAIAVAFVAGTIATGWQIYAQGPPAGTAGAPTHLEIAGFGTVICENDDEFDNVRIVVNFNTPSQKGVFLQDQDVFERVAFRRSVRKLINPHFNLTRFA